MAGKAPVFCNRAVYYALDNLTKNQLIDLVVSQLKSEMNELTDEQILLHVQRNMAPVFRARKDRIIDLTAYYTGWLKKEEEYRREHP